MERSINANLLRRWVIEAEYGEPKSIVATAGAPNVRQESFVPVPLPAPVVDDRPIKVEVRRGTLTVSVHWPPCAIRECALWLREVLK